MLLYFRFSSLFNFERYFCPKLLNEISKKTIYCIKDKKFPAILRMNFRPRINSNNDYYGSMAHNVFDSQLPWGNPFMMRRTSPTVPAIVSCGELRQKHDGLFVQMTGKCSNKRMNRFIELKDRHGVTQLVINEEKNSKLARRFANMPFDATITIIGYVSCRPRSSINETMPTGKIEVEVEDIIHFKMPKPGDKDIQQKRSYSTMTSNANKSCGITNVEYKMAKTENLLKWFLNRKITCNDLRPEDVGSEVQLIGWLSNANRSFLKFCQLKDGYGVTQIVLNTPELLDIVNNVASDSILFVKGIVILRPPQNINSNYETGKVEVFVNEIKVLDPNEPYDDPIKVKVQKLSENERNDGNNSHMDVDKPVIKIDTNKFTYRTHNCGELSLFNCRQNVIVCGWLQYHRMNKFIVLRDGYGEIQCIIPEVLSHKISNIPLESIVKVQGTVASRPDCMKNPKMKTGDIEIQTESIDILNEASRILPMDVRDFHRAKEALRMEHRYIDLRFVDMQRNLRMRSTLFMKIREFLINHLGFVEVETPTLFRRTPGGAQEFVVPTRKPSHFYSLVQSPQQFKQMLMAGAIDRYFQIARCYRDEATRPDRQPEFTQLDIELSFTDKDSILKLIEETLKFCWPKELNQIETPFPRITYDEAMMKYGTDKPDTRFEMILNDVSSIVSSNFSDISNFGAYAIVVKRPNSIFTSTIKKEIEKIGKEFNCKFFAKKRNSKNIDDWITESGIGKLLPPECAKDLIEKLDIQNDDLLFFSFGDKQQVQSLLGRIRLTYNEFLEKSDLVTKRNNDQYKFLWVLDFPMFSRADENQNNSNNESFESVHHPFTACHPDDIDKLKAKTDLCSIRSQAYDLVLNGQEIGGGSIRIHDSDLQKFVLDEILKIEHSHLKHLLEALKSGCPPHGGIALGLDRLMSIICNTKSIRDVIAFPKGLEGKDHLSKAPLPITEEEMRLYHLICNDKNNEEQKNIDEIKNNDKEIANEK